LPVGPAGHLIGEADVPESLVRATARLTVAGCLAGLAAVTAVPPAAARLWGAVQRLHDDVGITPPSTRLLHQQRLAALQETLGAESLQAALAEGTDAPADQGIAAALDNNLP
jgi:hypothetical protein